MVDGEVIEQPKPEKGWFGKAVKEAQVRIEQLENELTAANTRITELSNKVDAFEGANDPQEMAWMWQNFEQLVEVVSLLRKLNGLSPLAEFEGTKQRRRAQEARQN